MSKLKIGIFFGGQSREREISFAGGRTVYDNLNKEIFEPVPVFVDSLGNFILLDWQYIYKGTIRDFFPDAQAYVSPHFFQVYVESLAESDVASLIEKVGTQIHPHQFKNYFDIAFLALHGPYGEDGNLQGLLEWFQIPYTGSGILPSAIGISKGVQSDLMQGLGFSKPPFYLVSKSEWNVPEARLQMWNRAKDKLGLPFVVKAPNQGSSIGVSIIKTDDFETFNKAIQKSLFQEIVNLEDWTKKSSEEKVGFIRTLLDIREGIGMPVNLYRWSAALNGFETEPFEKIFGPEALLARLNDSGFSGKVLLESIDNENYVLLESFISGKEFSCIVIQNEDGNPIALPPTEIIKSTSVFDYRSKYLPGISRKITPIDVPEMQLQAIEAACVKLFKALQFNVYARLDGFLTPEGEVFLNDPNTTSGMLPSSFFFHQAAEIGLNPSQFLTYIIDTSLLERMQTGKNTAAIQALRHRLNARLSALKTSEEKKKKVAVIMGGFSSERHISVESGRNIYEKLASSGHFEPIPIFLSGKSGAHELYHIPINIMLKDNADDIYEKVLHPKETHPVIAKIRNQASFITQNFAGAFITKAQKIDYQQLSQMVDLVFIALHGRPGEDGEVQKELEKYQLPYNGSGIQSSMLTINKYETNEVLFKNGIKVANHTLVFKSDWEQNQIDVIDKLESGFRYPFIAKPADDGCSSAVKKIKNREELQAFAMQMFRADEALLPEASRVLKLQPKEEFPVKDNFLVESLIEKGDARHFLEVTCGMLTIQNRDGSLQYQIFEPSETLASGEILSLEEKFLAGEGQNITPARFSKNAEEQASISLQVRSELEKVARILNIEGYCRIDAFVHIDAHAKAETTIIEINSLPGMTPATCIFHQAAIAGYKPAAFIEQILAYAEAKKGVLTG